VIDSPFILRRIHTATRLTSTRPRPPSNRENAAKKEKKQSSAHALRRQQATRLGI